MQWNKEKVKRRLRDIKKEKGETPVCEDIPDDLRGACYRYFGNIGNAKRAAELTVFDAEYRKWTKEEALQELKKVAEEIGHSPTYEEIIKHRGSKDLTMACQKLFGGVNNVKDKLGLEKYTWEGGTNWKWDKEKTINELQKIIEDIRHFPSTTELKKMDKQGLWAACIKYIGSINEARKELGFDPVVFKDWTEERVIKEIKDVARKLGHSPTEAELVKLDRWDLIGACREYFEGLINTKKEAGLKIYPTPNEYERRVQKIINKFCFPFKFNNEKIKIGRTYPDFVSTDNHKRVIEVFGYYWHGKTDRYTPEYFQTKEGRKEHLSKYGYECLVLWTDEMKSMTDEEICEEIGDYIC